MDKEDKRKKKKNTKNKKRHKDDAKDDCIMAIIAQQGQADQVMRMTVALGANLYFDSYVLFFAQRK